MVCWLLGIPDFQKVQGWCCRIPCLAWNPHYPKNYFNTSFMVYPPHWIYPQGTKHYELVIYCTSNLEDLRKKLTLLLLSSQPSYGVFQDYSFLKLFRTKTIRNILKFIWMSICLGSCGRMLRSVGWRNSQQVFNIFYENHILKMLHFSEACSLQP